MILGIMGYEITTEILKPILTNSYFTVTLHKHLLPVIWPTLSLAFKHER